VSATAAPGVVCLTGVSPAGPSIDVDAGALGTSIVLENDVRRRFDKGGDDIKAVVELGRR
jgi:hypothetical protein